MSILDLFNPTQRLSKKYADQLIRQFGAARWAHNSTSPFESEFVPVRGLRLALGSHPRLVLTGILGSGKTTALASLALTHARALAVNEQALLPIYFSARALEANALPRQSDLPAVLSLTDFPSSFFQQAFTANRALVLIDDLDALTPDAASGLLQEFSNAHLVVSAHNAIPGLEEFPMPAWRDQDIERYAHLRFVERANEFLGALKASGVPRLITSNPMSLALTAYAWESEAVLPSPANTGAAAETDLHTALGIKPLPTRRTEIFAACARGALKGDDDAARRLEGIALAIQRGKLAPDEFVAKSSGLLRETKNDSCDFIHDLWRAYFAARAARLAGDLTALADHLPDPDWRETILFYAGLGDASDLIAALIQQNDWHLAGEAIAHAPAVRTDLRERVTQELVERAWNGDLGAPVVLGKMLSDPAITAFAARLKDTDPIVRARAAEILGRLQLDRALEYLLPQMRDVNADTRDRVVQALGHSLSNRVIEPLLGAFRGDPRVGSVDTRLRVAAAQALGQVGSDKAVPALIVDLQTGEPEVRAVAVQALERIHSPLMIKPLQGILPNLDEEMKKSVANALASMNGEDK